MTNKRSDLQSDTTLFIKVALKLEADLLRRKESFKNLPIYSADLANNNLYCPSKINEDITTNWNLDHLQTHEFSC